MRYSNSYLMQLKFEDGIVDAYQHPYLVLLDRNNQVTDRLLLVKGKTFNPAKHSRYVRTGKSFGPIQLKRQTVFNLVELCEVEDGAGYIFSAVNFNDFKDLSLALYQANNNNLLTNESNNIYARHKKDLEKRLQEHGLI